MQEEMNDEWFELAASNIHKLIPQEWLPRINEILPQILNIVKIGSKRIIKSNAETLGNNKMAILVNTPYQLKDSDIMIMVPTYYKIDKRQLGPSVLNEQTGLYELQLKQGEVPEITFSMMTLFEKLNAYTKIEDLIKDFKEGKFLSLADMGYNPPKPEIETPQQKQLESGQ